MPPDAVNLVSHLLQYSPPTRYNALQARPLDQASPAHGFREIRLPWVLILETI